MHNGYRSDPLRHFPSRLKHIRYSRDFGIWLTRIFVKQGCHGFASFLAPKSAGRWFDRPKLFALLIRLTLGSARLSYLTCPGLQRAGTP